MGYINNYGKSLGPIQVDTTWIINYVYPALQEASREELRYLTFSHNKLNPLDALSPILAATPILGTYKDKQDIIQTCAPRNAVATVEWVVAYSSLKPGEMAGININVFATKDELKTLEQQINTLDSRVVDQSKKINLNTNNISKNTFDITLLRNRVTTNEKVIQNNTQNIQSMLEDPFPDGFILVCGEVS